MKKIFCVLLVLILFATTQFSAMALSVREELEPPFDEYMVELPDEIIGRSIWDMSMYNNKLYIGWGDYGTNLGAKLGGLPLLSYFDATNKWQLETFLDDEQIAHFYEYNDKLYITGTDPIKGIGNLYIGDKEGNWKTVHTFDGGIHVFDMTINEDVIYLGYGSSKAVVGYSVDGGETFDYIEFFYDGKSLNSGGGAAGRSYNLFSLGSDVYATLNVGKSTDKYSGIYKLDKTNMVFNYVAKGPKYVIVNSVGTTFDGEFLGNYFNAYKLLEYTSNPCDGNSWQTFSAVDGTVTCAKVIDDELYVMAYTENGDKYTNTLYKTKDLKTAEVVYSFECETFVQSFCYGNDGFYFGTGGPSAGRVFHLGSKETQKTDLTVKFSAKADTEEAKPKWIRYKLMVGDVVLVEDSMVSDTTGWEFTLEGVDDRDDWKVEVIGDSVGYEWEVTKTDGNLIVTNKTETDTEPVQEQNGTDTPKTDNSENNILIIILAVVGGIVIAGGITVFVILRKKKNKV